MKRILFFNRLEWIFALWLLASLSEPGHGQTFRVPLHQTNGWQFLKYNKIPSNTYRGTESGFEIGVTNSAAPAVFPLPNTLKVTEMKASGRISNMLNMSADKQGQEGFDDYTVRVGLVVPGARTLNWGARLIAADWVKRLYALAPDGTGISRIHFFNVGTDAQQIGNTRTHPLSDLMQETVVAVPDADGHFAFTHRFDKPLSVVAIWVSCDGDDTKSSFSVTLDQIALDYRNPPPRN